VRAASALTRRIIVIQFISMGAMEMSNPFWPLYLQGLVHDRALLSLAGAGVYILPMLGVALTSIWWGRMGDRVGHRWMMIRALIGLALTQLALAFSSGAVEVLVLRFLQGALAGFIAPAQAYCAALTRRRQRYRLFARLQIATNVGSFLGALAGGALLGVAPFFWLNTLAALACTACALAVAVCLPPLQGRARLPASTRLAVRASGHASADLAGCQGEGVPGWLRTTILALGLLLAARMILQLPLSLYAEQVLQFAPWQTGLSYGLVALGFCAGAGAWARHFERQQAAGVMRVQRWLAWGLALVGCVLGVARVPGWFFAGQFIVGVLLAATTPILTGLVSRHTPAGRQGAVLGRLQSVSQCCSVVGVACGAGLLYAGELAHIYFYVAAAYLVAWWVLQRVRPPAASGS